MLSIGTWLRGLLLARQLRLEGSSDSVSRRLAPSRWQLCLAMRSISMQLTCDRSLSQDSCVRVRCLHMQTAETPSTKQYICVGSTELMSCAMSWNWMRYVTRTNEPCQPYEGASAHIRMSQYLYVNVACHAGTCEWCNWNTPHQF